MYTKLTLLPPLVCTRQAEAIATKNNKYFQLTLLSSSQSTSVSSKLTAPTSSNALLTKQIRDSSLEGQMINGDIPVYTWNTWGYGTRGGFSANRETNLSAYKNGRFKEQLGILYQLFNNSPAAIVCLQEVPLTNPNVLSDIQNALNSLNVGIEHLSKTGTESFGQAILYRKDFYTPVKAYKPATPDNFSTGAAGRFSSTADANQNDRVLKVYFEERTGQKRQIAVVNVHLKYQSPDFQGLIDELINYSQGKAPKPLAVIMGDFNNTISFYANTNPKVTVKQVGESVMLVKSSPSRKSTESNVDGFIIVQP